MKRLKLNVMVITLVLAMVATVNFVTPALAEQVDVYKNQQLVKSVVFKIGVPYYVVNGQTPGVKMGVAPFIQSGRTFVPVRFLGNALGVSNDNINWIDNVQRVFIAGPNNISLVMTIGDKEIQVNGVSKPIDVAPMLTRDRTFLPARYVAEGLGYQVGWDEANQAVVCWPAGQPKPDVTEAVKYLVSQANPAQSQGNVITTAGGYKIPKDTKLNLPDDIEELGPGDPNDCELQFCIDLTKGDLENQWEDTAAILSQKIDSQTVGEVMAYAKQKTEHRQELKNKFWDTAEKKVCVGSSWGSYGIAITVWYK